MPRRRAARAGSEIKRAPSECGNTGTVEKQTKMPSSQTRAKGFYNRNALENEPIEELLGLIPRRLKPRNSTRTRPGLASSPTKNPSIAAPPTDELTLIVAHLFSMSASAKDRQAKGRGFKRESDVCFYGGSEIGRRGGLHLVRVFFDNDLRSLPHRPYPSRSTPNSRVHKGLARGSRQVKTLN